MLIGQKMNGSALFVVQLAGIAETVTFNEGLFTVKPHTNITAIANTDLIIVPSLNHNYELALQGNELLVKWLEKQYKNGAAIASICTGAFLLAASGLLDGKNLFDTLVGKRKFQEQVPESQPSD